MQPTKKIEPARSLTEPRSRTISALPPASQEIPDTRSRTATANLNRFGVALSTFDWVSFFFPFEWVSFFFPQYPRPLTFKRPDRTAPQRMVHEHTFFSPRITRSLYETFI